VVVERASATEVGFGNDDTEAGGLEDFDCRYGCGGMEVVIEGIGPE
jgi:hypothetical protein